jgi:hypothetical protein
VAHSKRLRLALARQPPVLLALDNRRRVGLSLAVPHKRQNNHNGEKKKKKKKKRRGPSDDSEADPCGRGACEFMRRGCICIVWKKDIAIFSCTLFSSDFHSIFFFFFVFFFSRKCRRF